MKLSKKTQVLLALLAQVGPYPNRSEIINRTKVQIKINRLLAAKEITDVLNKREQFLFKTLKEYWIESSDKKKQIINMILVSDLKKLINQSIKGRIKRT